MDSNSNNSNLGGRPSKFEEDYCELLITHMNSCMSYESFAGVLGVCTQTLYNWEKQYPQFLDAKKIAFEKSRYWWEKQLTSGLWHQKDLANLNPTLWIFNMKNRFPKEWREKQEIAEESKQNVTHNISEELTETTKELIEVLKEWKKS